MTSSADSGSRRALAEQIAEIQAKVQLIEGDRRAFFESSQYTANTNQEKIQQLKRENKELLRKYQSSISCDEDTVNKAFRGHDITKHGFQGKTGQQIIQILDNRKSDRIKRLHLAQYSTQQKEKNLVAKIERLEEVAEKAAVLDTLDEYDNPQGRKNLALANEYEIFQVRNIEADEIEKHLSRILLKLSQESFGYEARLESLEKAIKTNEEELTGLKEMNRDAENSKEAARTELQIQEQNIRLEKRKREMQREELKKNAEIRKEHLEKLEELISRQEKSKIIIEDEQDGQRNHLLQAEETERKISAFEQAFQRIQQVTGVSNTAEAVDLFKNQIETSEYLEKLLLENSEALEKVLVKKKALTEEYEELKFQGSEKLQEAKNSLEDLQMNVESEKEKCKKTEKKMMEIYTILLNVRGAIEHIYSKLKRVKTQNELPEASLPRRDSDEYILELLNWCELKISALVAEIGEDTNLERVLKEMEDSDFERLLQAQLPPANTRVRTRERQREDEEDEEVESDDEDDVPTRVFIKKLSSYLVEQKTNRRPGVAQKKPPKLR